MMRLVCFLLGHRWKQLRVNWRKHANLVHLHTFAGFHLQCRRCGHEWDDTGGGFFTDRVYDIAPDAELPPARVVHRG